LETGKVTLGYVGGSITDPRPGFNWPEFVTAWMVDRYPGVRVVVENAAIGATGSDLAVFRAKRDLVDRGCDAVFVEFAVNDHGVQTAVRRQSREGLVRKLLAGEGRDVVLAYTFSQPMYAEMTAGTVPASVAEFEELAEHYAIPSVWMGLHALQLFRRGLVKWEEWLPDGLHPQFRGSQIYAESVTDYLAAELAADPDGPAIKAGPDMPAALCPDHWQAAHTIPLDAVETEGRWSLVRWPHCPWIDQALYSSAPGSRLRFAFDGRMVQLGFDFGGASSEFRWRIDGSEWTDAQRDRPPWCGARGWFRLSPLAADLAPGPHIVELEVVRGGEDCTGSDFCLGLIGVVP
jgi:lysophospholipase L1-like esterase